MKKSLGKQFFAILVMMACLASFMAGCSSDGKEETTKADNASTSEASTSTAAEAEYPTKEIFGIIPFGESGGVSVAMRAFTPALEKYIGESIVCENQPGAGGAVGAQYVLNQAADGYTLFLGSDCVCSFKALGTVDTTSEDWEPLMILLRDSGALSCAPGSIFADMNFTEVIDYIKEHPGEITFGSGGIGTFQWAWWVLLKDAYGIDVTVVDYSNASDATTALMGGHLDLYIAGSSARSLILSGDLIPITVMDTDPIEGYDCDTLKDYTSEFDSYMPIGSFFAPYVVKGTPDYIVEQLREACLKAYVDESFQTFIETSGRIPVGLAGEEAVEYVKNYESVLSWLLYDTGNTSVEPSEYGVERPK